MPMNTVMKRISDDDNVNNSTRRKENPKHMEPRFLIETYVF